MGPNKDFFCKEFQRKRLVMGKEKDNSKNIGGGFIIHKPSSPDERHAENVQPQPEKEIPASLPTPPLAPPPSVVPPSVPPVQPPLSGPEVTPPPVVQSPAPNPLEVTQPLPVPMEEGLEKVNETGTPGWFARYKRWVWMGAAAFALLSITIVGFLTKGFGLLAPSTTPYTSSTGTYARATIDQLRVREEPGSNGTRVLDGLSEGEIAYLLDGRSSFQESQVIRGNTITAPWFEVRTQRGVTGWVFGGGVEVLYYEPKLSHAAIINDPDGYTNVRVGPGTQHAILEQVYNGQVFQVLSMKSDWWKVTTPNGKTGFIHRSRVYLNGSFPGRYPDASRRVLTTADLRGYSQVDLRLMRNEIFARYGLRFNSQDLKAHFSAQPWYQPNADKVDHLLTDLERANIETILAQEKKALN